MWGEISVFSVIIQLKSIWCYCSFVIYCFFFLMIQCLYSFLYHFLQSVNENTEFEAVDSCLWKTFYFCSFFWVLFLKSIQFYIHVEICMQLTLFDSNFHLFRVLIWSIFFFFVMKPIYFLSLELIIEVCSLEEKKRVL